MDDVGDGPVSRICIFTLQWTYRFCVERRPTTLMDPVPAATTYALATSITKMARRHRRTNNGTINCAASIPPGLDYSLYYWEQAEDQFSVEEAELKKTKKGELLKEGIVVFLAEQYVFAPAQAACLEMVCLDVAPANCLETRNVFNESVNQFESSCGAIRICSSPSCLSEF